MIRNLCSQDHANRWGTGVVLAAAAAAVLGAGSPAAHADDGALATDIGLLTTSQTDINDGLAALSQLPGSSTPLDPSEYGTLIGRFEADQTPLLSSDNSFASSVGQLLFNGPDQQLSQASETFLTSVQALAADPSSAADQLDVLSSTFGFTDSLFGQSLPANIVGLFVDKAFGLGGVEPVTAVAATDAASSAATSTTSTPDEVIGQAISELNQGTALLDAAPTADLSTRSAEILSDQENLAGVLNPGLTEVASMQDMLSAHDQIFVGEVDQGLVSAAQNVVSSDQALVAADQAGTLSSNNILPVEFGAFAADLQLLSAGFNVAGADFLAEITGGLDPSSAADLAASLGTANVVDPSVLTDVLSSIGL